jgi:hypothetical protein
MSANNTTQLLQGAGKFYHNDIEGCDTYEEVWAGQIIQSSTATVAIVPIVTTSVGNQIVTLPTVSRTRDWAVSKNGTGKYVMTANYNLAGIKSINATLQCASVTGKVVQVGPVDLATQSVQFNVVTASTGAAVNLATNDSVHFRIELTGDNSQRNLE